MRNKIKYEEGLLERLKNPKYAGEYLTTCLVEILAKEFSVTNQDLKNLSIRNNK